MQGKLSAAIKLLDAESSSGLMDITQEVIEALKDKHPVAAEVQPESLLNGPTDIIPAGIFDLIDEKNYLGCRNENEGICRTFRNGCGTV